MTILCFDNETNGIKTWDNPDFQLRCVQLGAILQDVDSRRVLAEVNLIVHQNGHKIPAEATAVHGITDEIAARYGLVHQGVDALFARLIERADLVVAHNVQYDLDVVHDDLPLSDKAVRGKPTFCTMDSNVYVIKASLTQKQKDYFTSKGSKPDRPYKSPSLMETYLNYFEFEFASAHDASADVRACRDIFMAMLDAGYYEVVDGTLVPTKKLKEAET